MNNKKLYIYAVCSSLILGIGTSIIFHDIIYFNGFMLGTLVSIISFITIDYTTKVVLNRLKPSVFHSILAIFVRYILYLIAFIISFYTPYFNFYTTIMGIVMIQVVIIFRGNQL